MNAASKYLLLVEDNPIIALSEKMELEHFGYTVRHIMNGEAAVAAALEGSDQIDLILMDIDLGKGIDGTEAAMRILSRADVPIVFLSSHTEPEYLDRVEKITSYGFVEKGGAIRALDTTIRMALRLFDARRERDRIQNILLESERRYRYLFENLTEEVHLWKVLRDDAGAIISWRLIDANPAALSAWKRERDEVVGKRSDKIWPEADPIGLFKPIVEKVFSERSNYTWEQRFSGTNQILLMTTVSFDEYFFSVGQDISRFKLVEERLLQNVRTQEARLLETQRRISGDLGFLAKALRPLLANESGASDIDAIRSVIGQLESLGALYGQSLQASDGDQVSIRDYLTGLGHLSYDLFPNRENIAIDIQAEDIPLKAERLFPIGVIINELISNSFKHGFHGRDRGRISIDVSLEGEEFALRYRDDGIGLVADGIPRANGFGMTLIRSYCERLHGQLDFSGDDGLSFTMRFPYRAPA